MSAASRARGARAEVQVVNYLRANGWPDARRYLAGDGRQPGDIDFAPGVCLEVKDRAQSAWPSWREQCLDEADWRIAIVVRRTRGVRDVGEWICHVLVDTWGSPPPSDRRPVACDRTLRDWLVLPFSEVVAELRRQRIAPVPTTTQEVTPCPD